MMLFMKWENSNVHPNPDKTAIAPLLFIARFWVLRIALPVAAVILLPAAIRIPHSVLFSLAFVLVVVKGVVGAVLVAYGLGFVFWQMGIRPGLSS